MTLPNAISFFRLFSALLIVSWISEQRFSPAFILFSCAALSDLLDGFLARTLKHASRFGAYLDPLADKVLLMSVFVALSCQGKFPFWLTGIVIARDCQILLGIFSLYLKKRPFKMSPLLISKINTVLQMLLIFACLGGLSEKNLLYQFILYGTALSTLLSSAWYIPLWRKNMFDTPSHPLLPQKDT